MTPAAASGPAPAIAVLGASSERRKFGNKCVRAYAEAGWRVYPIHPREPAIEGLTAYPDLATAAAAAFAGGGFDRLSVYLPPPITRELLPAIAAAGAGEVWFNPGAADAAVILEASRRSIPVRQGCSIVDLGVYPSRYPD